MWVVEWMRGHGGCGGVGPLLIEWMCRYAASAVDGGHVATGACGRAGMQSRCWDAATVPVQMQNCGDAAIVADAGMWGCGNYSGCGSQ